MWGITVEVFLSSSKHTITTSFRATEALLFERDKVFMTVFYSQATVTMHYGDDVDRWNAADHMYDQRQIGLIAV
jgi:hypothetical protein